MVRTATVLIWLAIASPASAQPLISDHVFVVRTADTTATITGLVNLIGDDVGGLAAIGEDKAGQPQLQLLGCRFDIQLEERTSDLDRLASIFSRKLTSIANADPPSAGVGRLLDPTPVGIVDPVTSIACDPRMHYKLFLYRQGASSRTPTIEALVFEFADGGDQAIAPAAFNSHSERPSIQSRDAVLAARGLYRVKFQSEQALDKIDERQRQVLSDLIFVAPKLLGLPVP